MAKALAEDRWANVSEFLEYPTAPDDLQSLIDESFNVIALDLDSDPDIALDVVERLSAIDAAPIMVFSQKNDPKLAVRFMRAGARDFLLLPLDQGTVAEALIRIANTVRPKAQVAAEHMGRLHVFVGAKGGSGVTTVACNLAVALAQERNQTTLLIDLVPVFGDAALTLGITAEYSTEDALQNADRLDTKLLHSFLGRHKSGLFVLAAPSKGLEVKVSKDAIDQLVAVALQKFDHVIVDVGSRIDLTGTAIFKKATTIYLVALTGVSDLRNSSLLISQFFGEIGSKLEVVINRFEPHFLQGVDEDVITKALGRPVRWKIPEDKDGARQKQFGEIGLEETRIMRMGREMAGSITGRRIPKEKKRSFGFKGLGKSIAEEVFGNDDPPSISIAPPADSRLTPTIAWPTPGKLTSGEALTADQLNATPSVAGTFDYSPALGEVLAAGKHKLSVTFTPTDSARYTNARATVSITVSKATPTIEWATPRAIKSGTQLSATQFRATASVPGTFDYSPALNEVLEVGKHTLTATFTPEDSANYAKAQATVSLTVNRTTPTVEWVPPQPIECGKKLSAEQLCATASVPGAFDYSPALGETLKVGTHTLSLLFTPTDDASYTATEATVPITVVRATPTIEWATPKSIECGTPLDTAQLCATASIPGKYAYSPALGDVLQAGVHTLSVTFTPRDRADYTSAEATVSITVTKAKPAIEWPAPKPMKFGTLLSATQLCATASVPGTFDYLPAPGTLLLEGTHTLSLVFTPKDSTNYATAEASVSLTVAAKAIPVITWSDPEPIRYGTLLSARQFSATASVPGSFDYLPAMGELLEEGTHTLSVIFTPRDIANYAMTEASVSLTVVAKATPIITWSNPEPITYGTLLGTNQFNASASVPGTFRYSRALDELLEAGTHTLSVTFTPRDKANYTSAKASVSIRVTKTEPVIEWPAPKPMKCGTQLSATQLCAAATVPGTFDYFPAPGALLPEGAHTLSLIFTPQDNANYAMAEASVSLTVVAKAIPVITWSNPEPITHGAMLSPIHFSATASVPGTFEYSHMLGEVLEVGSHLLCVTFTPADSTNYVTTKAAVPLTVEAKATPVITWSNPEPITYGTLLSAKQLNASTSVPGTFCYSHALDELLEAGTHTLSVTFTPRDSANYTKAQAAVSLTVGRATPTIKWTTPKPIRCGTALSVHQLRAVASVPGVLEYSPALGEWLETGTHTLTATFTPADSANYSASQATVSLTVEAKVTPVIAWSNPEPIKYGSLLSTVHFGAIASVPGTFDYSHALGEVLEAGTHKLFATFTPTDSANYTQAQAAVSLTVTKAIPGIAWSNPDPIIYGTLLNSTQLCATVSVPGNFDYSPAPDKVLAAGTHMLTARFTPADSANYAVVEAAVSLNVIRATPTTEWPAPEPITWGRALSSNELRAAASVPGSFHYSPAQGEVLAAGKHTLSAIFIPTDSANYASTQVNVSLTVAKATPTINWPTPDLIEFGTQLGNTELCATASIPGKFDYSPTFGELLEEGSHTLSVTFTPTDGANYAKAEATVLLRVVVKEVPVISWPTPNPITYHKMLTDTELCATTSVPGTFVYSPAQGEVLVAGMHKLSVTFTPTDSINYATAQATVSLTVAKATPSIQWLNPRPIKCGTALTSTQLYAEAWIQGKFVYSPAAGEVLPLGTHKLTATFTPEDSSNNTEAQATVELSVIKDTPSIKWPTPKSIKSGGVLSATQLNATASVPGTFYYSPAIGEVMDAGTHTLSVTFTPTDSEKYATALATVSLDVVPRAKPVILWSNPDPISYGTSLGVRQLSATTSIPGTFEYVPGPGAVPTAGMRVLSATFTPADSVNYAPAETFVMLYVTKARPTIEWPTPSQITAGKALSAKQLCAEASIPGTFEYSPALGETLGVGRYILSASFTPADTDNYSISQTSVDLQVEPFRWGRIVAAACACLMLLLLIFLIPMFISKTKSAAIQTVQPPSAVTVTPAPVKPTKRKRRSHTTQTKHKIAATSEAQK